MITLEYTKEITDTGLTPEQAVVYEALLKLGELPASAITKSLPRSTTFSRPLVYKILEELIALDLAEKHDEPGKVATFLPKHPIAITKAIDERKARIEHTKQQFQATASRLSSLFNLATGKPGVTYYEGMDGVWEVLMDNLKTSDEVLTISDTDAVAAFAAKENERYKQERERLGVRKRILFFDSPTARKSIGNYPTELTDARIIPLGTDPLYSVMHIYGTKVSYVTFDKKHTIGVIIDDANIHDLHQSIFEVLWKLGNNKA